MSGRLFAAQIDFRRPRQESRHYRVIQCFGQRRWSILNHSGQRVRQGACYPRSPKARDRGHPILLWCGESRIGFVRSHPSPEKRRRMGHPHFWRVKKRNPRIVLCPVPKSEISQSRSFDSLRPPRRAPIAQEGAPRVRGSARSRALARGRAAATYETSTASRGRRRPVRW